MSRRFLSATMIVALAMAFLLAWTGHAYSLSVLSPIKAQSAKSLTHYHSHDSSLSCAQCSDHYHSPLTPDHQHETPQIPAAIHFSSHFEASVHLAMLGDSVPWPPIFRIERPPRPVLAS